MSLPKRILDEMKKYPPFYQAVWMECAKIPKGRTLTYGELAKRLGKPKAARAVGQALGKNPFVPAVPCHRVVGKNGALTGYSGRGGITAKRRLLAAEGAL